jgi:hypothetical protein
MSAINKAAILLATAGLGAASQGYYYTKKYDLKKKKKKTKLSDKKIKSMKLQLTTKDGKKYLV